LAAGAEVLARGYAGDPAATELADTLLADIDGTATPDAAYLLYCAGEADLAFGDVDQARQRFEQALQLAEATNARFVTGVAGASKVSIDARLGDAAGAARDYRKLIHHWRRAGMWSTQWTMLRSIAVLLDRLGRHQAAAVLEGAVRATSAGHRIFGSDEAALGELAARLREALGDDAYETARQQGGALDGNAAVEYALHAL
jgi:tetratricopeptide (TPR) repeat protein